ncbi:MAG: c-type cytochrome domain-containing protein, partial [Opitutaceae bacterium]
MIPLLVAALNTRAADVPDFNRDVRPILSNNCFLCHGPDEDGRKGGQKGLRLDTREGALEDLGGGAFAIVPGQPEKSELLKRLVTTDTDEVMPPPKTGKKLTAAEIDVLRR